MPHTNLFWRSIRPEEGFYESEVQTPQPHPVRSFLPTGYEPNYAYPLVVFFHGEGGSEEQTLKLAPRLSRRNFISIALRGLHAQDADHQGRIRYGWGCDGQFDSEIEDYVFRAVEQTRRNYHVHSERIYLAGICEGATVAYRLGLQHPDKFGGIVSLNGAMPRQDRPLLRLHEIRSMGVFIGHGIANAYTPLTFARQDRQLFYAAGLDVEFETYATTHKLHGDMLRDVNRWIVRRCCDDV